MKKRSKWLAFLLAAAVSIGSLSGCGSSGNDTQPAANEGTQAASEEASEAADDSASTDSAADSTG